jgi:hypothetical protein
MGVIQNGILGGFSGKVGPVVGGRWKDIDYMRSYVIPSNPNSPSQQTVRAKFAALVAAARQILASVLQPYWDPFYPNMSGFNAWISKNYAPSDSAGVLDDGAIMSKGTLFPQAIDSANYDTVTGQGTITWSQDLTGNQLGTDLTLLVVLDAENQDLYFFSDAGGREGEETSYTIRTGLTAANVICFLFFAQGTGSEMIVSDSVAEICVAA